MRRKAASTTPVRSALVAGSTLLPCVKDGLGAVESGHLKHLDVEIRGSFGDSLDLDQALLEGHEQQNRWDYLLGHTPTGEVIALEPHSARTDEVSTVIRKRQAAQEQLRQHLSKGARVSSWLWVASGKVDFADTEKERRRLDQEGIQFVGKLVRPSHLPAATQLPAATPLPAPRARKPGKKKP